MDVRAGLRLLYLVCIGKQFALSRLVKVDILWLWPPTAIAEFARPRVFVSAAGAGPFKLDVADGFSCHPVVLLPGH
jgi:hypothetical protein